MFNASTRLFTRAAILGLAIAAGAANPTAARAQAPQVQAVEPYCIAVNSDSVPLKGGAGLVYYAVAMLKAGQVLRVDGQAPGGWLRVEYPRNLKAFIKADEAAPEADGKTLKLTKPSTLMSVNISGGERGHWWYLIEEAKPAGTTFPLAETLKTPDGKVYGYLIPAPPEARGYVKAESTRRATAQETDAFLQANGVLAAAPGAKPTPPPTAPTPAGPTPGGSPVASGPQMPNPADPYRLNPPTPDANTNQAPDSATQTTPPAPAVAAVPAPAPAERKTGTVEALQSLYEQVQTGKDAELSSVIAEFERSMGRMGSSADDQRTTEFLRARLEVLKLRQAVQTSKESAGQAARSVDEEQLKLTEQVRTLEKQRNYSMVGRLVPSTVYDGKRLPKMYRIQALEAGFARTIGYLSPARNEELDSKLGKVVGVVGESRFDEALRLNIATPKRVDVLSVAEIPNLPSDQKPVVDGQPVRDSGPSNPGGEN